MRKDPYGRIMLLVLLAWMLGLYALLPIVFIHRNDLSIEQDQIGLQLIQCDRVGADSHRGEDYREEGVEA